MMNLVVLADEITDAAGLSAALAERLGLPLLQRSAWAGGFDESAVQRDGFVVDGRDLDRRHAVELDAVLDRRAARIDLAVHLGDGTRPHPALDYYAGRVIEVDGPNDAEAPDRALERIREALSTLWV